MSTKLRDLIRNVRSCKTAAEERALIQREKAAIRESFLANENEFRPRNVAKLLFVSMLGHDTDFGQMECLKLITANSFTEKRIGYLGLTQLFNEKSEVLMMATNRIRIDLNNQASYIVSLALMALSEICTAEMCLDLSGEVLKQLSSGTSYIKKKAALASTRIVKKVPEKIDDFADKVEILLEDRHHGVLIATLQLCQNIIQTKPEIKTRFTRFVGPMVRILKSLVTTYSAEYDISGISDPFLQIEILRFFRIMCAGNQGLSDEVSDILAQVTTNTTSNKNTGNAVLYEAVKTIMAIESANTLKTLGINILGKFLANKDSNSKYVSLFMLQKVLKHDILAVQKYKSTILDCLKENDTSIKTLALDLIYLITNESNVKSIIKELLNYLLNLTDDNEFIQELTNKICSIVDKYAPNRRWYVDTIIKVLILAGNFVGEECTSSLIHLISGTPELQSYAVHKLYFSLQENLNQEGLSRATLYCLGDFGQILVDGSATAIDNSPIQVSEDEVITLIEKVFQKTNQTDTVREYALTSLIKLYSKFKTGHLRISALIKQQTQSSSIEVQKRAIEYLRLLDNEWDSERKGVCEQIPPSKSYKQMYVSKPIGDTDIDEVPPEANRNPGTNLETSDRSLIDDIIGLNLVQPQSTTLPDKVTMGNNDPMDLIGSLLNETVPVKHQPQQQTQQQTQPWPQQQQQPTQQTPISSDPFDILNLYIPQQTIHQPQQILIQVHYQSILYLFKQQQPYQQQQFQQQPTNLIGQMNSPGQQANSPILLNSPQILTAQSSQASQMNFKAFDDNSLEIHFNANKDSTPDNTSIVVSFNNKSNSVISNIVFSVAVLKYLKLQMNPLNSNSINPNSYGQVSQITNTVQGQKAIVMKLKIGYTIDNRQVNNEVTINQFPASY